jgi:hypothetical protein
MNPALSVFFRLHDAWKSALMGVVRLRRPACLAISLRTIPIDPFSFALTSVSSKSSPLQTIRCGTQSFGHARFRERHVAPPGVTPDARVLSSVLHFFPGTPQSGHTGRSIMPRKTESRDFFRPTAVAGARATLHCLPPCSLGVAPPPKERKGEGSAVTGTGEKSIYRFRALRRASGA